MNYKKIAHISDIHIRLFKRHKEYQIVFDRLYDQLREIKEPFIIVVTGDIVHSKTDMSPEMVSLVSKFFTDLANIAETVIIPGNHDLNLANKHRMDALSPIVDNLNHPSLTYLKESGVFNFNNIDFVHYSLVDGKEKWPTADDLFFNGHYKIGLYHGPVYTAATDIGYTITDRHVDVGQFRDMDMTLLGDIHRYQQLPSAYGPVVYAGSLVQQNHGEKLEGHGWVEWDLETRTHKHHEVVNDFGYATIRVSKDSQIDIPNNLPVNVRLRLFLEGFDSTATRELIEILKQNINISELSINQTNTMSVGSTGSHTIIDPHDVNTQNRWIKEYLEQNFPGTSMEVIESVFAINKRLNTKIQDDELPRNVHWRPLKLNFDNLFSYGTGNEITFENMNGIYGVFSPNASGKTSAFDAMCFALYDKTPRAFKGNHIMNTREDEMSCKLEFVVDDQLFIIERKGSRKKNGDVKVDVSFCKYTPDGEKVNLNGEDRRSTNANIRSYVGTYEDFILTTLSVQNQNSIFIDTGQTERKDLLSQFIGLTIFDRLYTAASDESKEIYGQLKTYIGKNYQEEKESIETEIKKQSEMIVEMDQKLNHVDAMLRASRTFVTKLHAQKIPNIEQIDGEKVEEDLAMYTAYLSGTHAEVAEIERLLSIAKDELQSAQESYDQKYGGFQEVYSNYSKLKKKQNDLDREIQSLDKDVAELEKKLSHLRQYEYDPNCSFCVNNIFVKDAQSAEGDLRELETERILLNDILLQVHSDLDLLGDVEQMIVDKDVDQENIKKLQGNIFQLKSAHDREISNLGEYGFKVESLEESLRLYNDNKVSLEKNVELDKEIKKVESALQEIETEDSTIRQILQRCTTQRAIAEQKLEALEQEILKRDTLEKEYEAYENYLMCVGLTGLPYQLIAKIIPEIQNETNKLLHQVVDFSIIVDVDGKNINGKIVYEDSRTWPLELASGMEKFVTGLAIRVALTKISSLPKPNFLVIDEGFGVLDSDNLASMSMMFDLLKSNYDFVIMISHLDSMRDLVDSIIEIQRSDGYSKMVV